MVGFDTSELPWSPDTFVDDRGFVLRAIQAAKARTGWERLEYEPQGMEHFLDLFQAMVEAFSIEHASESEDAIWPHGRPTQLMLCPVHRVYQHQEGCVLCNDGPFW
jgi:hypothetical protein